MERLSGRTAISCMPCLMKTGKPLHSNEEPERACFFTYKDLKKATRNFDHKLGDGGYGEVYKGKFPDGQMVVVKVRFNVNPKQDEQFSNWANILYRYRHQNLVAFYGYTNPHDSEQLLVYEFVPNGTLSDHLHKKQPTLPWYVRIQIAIETAAGLAYLHSVRPLIVHNDVKSLNILLDDAFHVKVSGFSENGLFPWDTAGESTVIRGTVGYQDPEYYQTLRLTDKSDVYSFGVLLLELISGKQAIDVNRDVETIYLIDLGRKKILNNMFDEFVDSDLGYHTDDDVTRMIDSVAALACECLEMESNARPPMVDVLKILKEIKDGTQLKQ